ncbi:hypothetical protein PQG65_05555 [Corynebacterium pseudodiphtheriticum]|uniref:hypothetical protein n=1 Tax=Corynebacterium pseudodiphtheriticum TaxID=37637 RepID=UPI00234D8DA9|nr:hypothetical protein [Corynebacterium pseudodiphtheriticum]MDC7110840.1 hypothetical protein [Corynebacterium pseudodiphtheriticum]MDC7114796.1 hypothetical protein [Corynebacterium pseudodiphtheriticum]
MANCDANARRAITPGAPRAPIAVRCAPSDPNSPAGGATAFRASLTTSRVPIPCSRSTKGVDCSSSFVIGAVSVVGIAAEVIDWPLWLCDSAQG